MSRPDDTYIDLKDFAACHCEHPRRVHTFKESKTILATWWDKCTICDCETYVQDKELSQERII